MKPQWIAILRDDSGRTYARHSETGEFREFAGEPPVDGGSRPRAGDGGGPNADPSMLKRCKSCKLVGGCDHQNAFGERVLTDEQLRNLGEDSAQWRALLRRMSVSRDDYERLKTFAASQNQMSQADITDPRILDLFVRLRSACARQTR